jgi:hypothetical protein
VAHRFLRFLLDQNFPEPPGFDMVQLDATVTYEHLRAFNPGLVSNTPDWLIYLHAQEAGFDGLVTRDWHQSLQPEEMVALSSTKLTIVTWRRSIDDPVVEWGQLLAYMPQVKRAMSEHRGRCVVFLPQPSLHDQSVRSAREELADMARQQGESVEQVRREARETMLHDLARRGLDKRFGSYVTPRQARRRQAT